MKITITPSKQELVESICEENSAEEVQELICSLDANMQDYDFTKEVTKKLIIEMINCYKDDDDAFTAKTLIEELGIGKMLRGEKNRITLI